MRETILKRLLIDGHITVQELIILGAADFYQTRDPHSFPPKPYDPGPFYRMWEETVKNIEPEMWTHKHINFTQKPYYQSPTIVTSKL